MVFRFNLQKKKKPTKTTQRTYLWNNVSWQTVEKSWLPFWKISNQVTALGNKIVAVVLKTDSRRKDKTKPCIWIPNENTGVCLTCNVFSLSFHLCMELHVTSICPYTYSFWFNSVLFAQIGLHLCSEQMLIVLKLYSVLCVAEVVLQFPYHVMFVSL